MRLAAVIVGDVTLFDAMPFLGIAAVLLLFGQWLLLKALNTRRGD